MKDNVRREIQKAKDVLEDCQEHLEYVAKANAKLHLADEVFYSPLHAKVRGIINGLNILLATENE